MTASYALPGGSIKVDPTDFDASYTRQRAEEARAKFRPGMAVSFRARRGQRLEGIIEKLNPKRARVNCGEAVFLVPYLAMEVRAADRERRDDCPFR